MVSRPRAKGTRRESGWLPLLRRVWPNVKRAGTTRGPNDLGDYLDTGDWVVESKHAKVLAMQDWVRQTASKAEPELRPWLILCRADKRKFPWDLMVMDAEQGVLILEVLRKLDLLPSLRVQSHMRPEFSQRDIAILGGDPTP